MIDLSQANGETPNVVWLCLVPMVLFFLFTIGYFVTQYLFRKPEHGKAEMEVLKVNGKTVILPTKDKVAFLGTDEGTRQADEDEEDDYEPD